MKHLWIPLCACLLLGGCGWQDAGELSAVTAGAVSRTEDGYFLTAELAVPSADSAIPGSVRLSDTAETPAQAALAVGRGQDVRLYWSHARVLLLDESVLAGGIGDCVREWYALDAVRPSVSVCVVRGSEAKDVFACESVSGEPVGFALGDSLSYAAEQTETPETPLYTVYHALETDGLDPVLPAVSITDGRAVLDGCALFSGEAFAGWLDAEDTAALTLLMNQGESAVWYAEDGEEIRLRDTRTTLDASDGLRISVRADAACREDADAEKAARVVRTRCERVLSLLREAGCDALGLGRLSGSDWRNETVTVEVTIHAAQSTEGGSE